MAALGALAARVHPVGGRAGGLRLLPRAEPRRRGGAGRASRRARLRRSLNKYPYASGHLMVAPVPSLRRAAASSSEEEALEIHRLGGDGVERPRRPSMGPQGFNLGWNLGRVAGAGVVDHVHQHVVPRWAGDTNFMPVLADVKVMPEALEATRRKLAEAWPSTPRSSRPTTCGGSTRPSWTRKARTRSAGRTSSSSSPGRSRSAATCASPPPRCTRRSCAARATPAPMSSTSGWSARRCSTTPSASSASTAGPRSPPRTTPRSTRA